MVERVKLVEKWTKFGENLQNIDPTEIEAFLVAAVHAKVNALIDEAAIAVSKISEPPVGEV